MPSLSFTGVLNAGSDVSARGGFRISSNPFRDELPWPAGAGACKRDTGYPPELIFNLWEKYNISIFKGEVGPATGFGHITATLYQLWFYLVFVYIHVSRPTKAIFYVSTQYFR